MKTGLVFLDMDGVLARFAEQPNALDRFEVEKGFFRKLEPTAFARKLAEGIKDNKINLDRLAILTASPNKQADKDKLDWIREYLPEVINIVIVRNGEDKAQFAKGNILIDDYTRNLEFWQENGGMAVKAINKHNGKSKRHIDLRINEIRVD